jgi:ABC-type dipeptide/oligopeptide/nickel transport system permease subunit
MTRRLGRSGVLGAALLGLLVALAVVGPLLAADPYLTDYPGKLAAPSPAHPLGTDSAGRDVAARLATGARVTLASAGAVWTVAVAAGIGLGALGGFAGAPVQALIARAVDLALALPQVLVALALAGALGPGLRNLIVAMSATAWAPTARLATAYVRGGQLRPDVTAARMAGASSWVALARHVLPGACARVVVVATLGLSQVILSLAGLSFLGLGVSPPTAEWGQMVSQGRSDLLTAPWVVLAPAAAIVVAVAATSLAGDALRSWVDGDRR